MKTLNLIAAAIIAVALGTGSAAYAQTAAPAEPTATANAEKKTSKRTKPFAPKSEKAKACSMKADEQKLRGKARKKFRSDCMKVV
jgi:hypothetical protein